MDVAKKLDKVLLTNETNRESSYWRVKRIEATSIKEPLDFILDEP